VAIWPCWPAWVSKPSSEMAAIWGPPAWIMNPPRVEPSLRAASLPARFWRSLAVFRDIGAGMPGMAGVEAAATFMAGVGAMAVMACWAMVSVSRPRAKAGPSIGSFL
jgi:hypothetical protein